MLDEEVTGQDVIRAAGGVLRRDTAEGKQVAVIHRTRYRKPHGEWSLPKGKALPGESWQDTARREVREETGCAGKIEGFAGSLSYLVKGVPKVVVFFHMTAEAEPGFQPNDEVDQLVWLPVGEAIERLDHPDEKRLLRHAFDAAAWEPRIGRSFLSRMRRWSPVRSQSHRRLGSSLFVFSKELDVLAGPADESPWAATARGLLREAERALDDNEPERGWQCFFAAQRASLPGLGPEKLAARAQLLLAEADSKLKGWRKQAVQSVLTAAGPKPDAFAVALAQQTLHEHFSNEYEKLRAIRQQTRLLCVIALAAVLTSFWLPVTDMRTGSFRGLAILYGVLGAAISGILSLANASEKRIPQLLLHFSATMARVSVGAVAAYVIFTFLQAGILPFNLADGKATWLVLALSFVAGFSERFLVRAVEAASG